MPQSFRCPYMQGGCGYYENYYRGDYDQNFTYEDPDMDFELGLETEERNLSLSREQMENIAAEVKKGSGNLLTDMAKFIKDSRLLDYMLFALINYIVVNYQRYEHVIDEKTDELVDELKENLPWLFDILKAFNITPEMVDDFLDGLIRVTVMTIRRLAPTGL